MLPQPATVILRIKAADQYTINKETIDRFKHYFIICKNTEEVILSEGFRKKISDGVFPLRVVAISTLPSKFSEALEAVDPLGYRLLPHELLFALAENTLVDKEILLAMHPVTYGEHQYLFVLGRSSIRAVRAVDSGIGNISMLPFDGNILFCQPGAQASD